MSIYKKNRGSIESIHQLGIGGPNLKNNSGVIEAKNAADSALAVVRAADPSGDTDLAPKGWINSNFAIEMDSLTYGRLKRNSTTQYQIEPVSPGIKDFVYVNDERVDISTPKTNNMSDNLLTATGTDSGGAAAIDTLYNSYLSNSSASYAPSSLRLSATAPTNRYLAASGNGANWLFVGALETDGLTQITHDRQVCGYGTDIYNLSLVGNTVRSSGGAAYYSILAIPNVVTLDTTDVIFQGSHAMLFSVPGYVLSSLGIAGNSLCYSKQDSVYGNTLFASQTCTYNSGSIQSLDYAFYYYYPGAGTVTVYGGAESTFVNIIRITRG